MLSRRVRGVSGVSSASDVQCYCGSCSCGGTPTYLLHRQIQYFSYYDKLMLTQHRSLLLRLFEWVC